MALRRDDQNVIQWIPALVKLAGVVPPPRAHFAMLQFESLVRLSGVV